jgi:hypothetical protein
MLKLEPLMVFRAELKEPVAIGAAAFGDRQIYDITGGTFEGSRLKGKVLASGGDWLLIDSKGVARLDVRATLETHDGARIYVQYYGVLVMNEKIVQALESGGETQFGDTYFVTQPRFETSDERYAWVNSAMAVAEGRTLPNAVEYTVYEVVGG